MQELDAFEKYLKEQLKGHKAPQELMWKRLHDVIGKPKVWYAKSIYKYALTAITAAGIGAGSTFFFMNQQKENSKVQQRLAQQSKQSLHPQADEAKLSAALLPLQIAEPSSEKELLINGAQPTSEKVLPINGSEPTSEKELLIIGSDEPINETIQTTALNNNIDEALAPNVAAEERALQTLRLKPIPVAKQNLKMGLASKNNLSRLSIQIASRNALGQLHTPAYNLNNSATFTQRAITQQKPTLQLQYHFPKGWFIGLGLGLQQISLTENFNKTNVYSYDDKEHYLFTYVFGQRKIADEQLENGPWPNFPPNPPFGSDTSHVHTHYESAVRLNFLEVPIQFGYEKRIGNFGLQLSTGLNFNYITTAQQTLSIPGYSPSQLNITQHLERWSIYQQQSLKFEYFANRHLGIYLEPSYLLQWKGYESQTGQGFKLNLWQLTTGISWKF